MAPGILRRCLPLALLAIAILASADDAAAQRPAAVRDGRRALSFNVLAAGGAGLGYTLMVTPRTAFTIDFNGSAMLRTSETGESGVLESESDHFNGQVTIAPGFRRYMAGRGDVASYVAGRAMLGAYSSIMESRLADGTGTRTESWSPFAGGAAGFGLEWFVTDEMSLRGETALDVTWEYRHDKNNADREQTSTILRAGLGQSAVTFSIWF